VRAAVLVLSGIDATLRAAATDRLINGAAGVVVVQYDVDHRSRSLRRVLATDAGVMESDRRGIGACATCAVGEDALVTTRALAARGARSVVVALPPTMTPVPLTLGVQYSQAPIALAASVTVFDLRCLAEDLLGADLLADRGLNLGRDPRTVSEALSRQLGTADLLLTVGPTNAGATLLDHIAGEEPTRCELHRVNSAAVLRRRRPARLGTRGDPRLAEPTGAADRDGVWTLDLLSPAALHPQRLLDRLAVLSSGRVRSRGYFWLPGAPALQYGWEAGGGRPQLEVLDQWADTPHTRLVVTGDDDSGPRIAAAFRAALLTDAESHREHWPELPEQLRRRIRTRRYRCAAPAD
jgi:G3E family GTPase